VKSKNFKEQVLLRIFLFLGIIMIIGCGHFCAKPKPPESPTEIIVVGKSPFVSNEDGTYTVSRDWFLERMSVEEELMTELNYCIQGEEQ
jgi:hypothetical protein